MSDRQKAIRNMKNRLIDKLHKMSLDELTRMAVIAEIQVPTELLLELNKSVKPQPHPA